VERREAEKRIVIVSLTGQGRDKLNAARPIHAASVRRNLLERLSSAQIKAILQIRDVLGEESAPQIRVKKN